MGILILILLQTIICGLYIAWRIYKSFFEKYNRALVVSSVLIINSLFLILRVLNKTFGIEIPYWLTFFSHILLGIIIYMFLFFILNDIIMMICKIFKIKYITLKKQGIVVVTLSLLTFVYGYWNSHNTKIKSYQIELAKEVTEPFRIAALTDLHIGADMTPSRLEKEVNIINSYKPDLVVIAGDLIDHDIKDFTDKHKEVFKKIKSQYGVYAVFGNHEYYSGDPIQIRKLFEESDMNVLKDESVYIDRLGLNIIGRDSLRSTHSDGSERKSTAELKKLIKEPSKPILIIDHVPKGVKDGQELNADIQISGHTHDGQFFPFNLIVRQMYELSDGMMKINNFYYFVSSGLGLWGPPMRVGTDSELLIIDII